MEFIATSLALGFEYKIDKFIKKKSYKNEIIAFKIITKSPMTISKSLCNCQSNLLINYIYIYIKSNLSNVCIYVQYIYCRILFNNNTMTNYND